MTDALIAHLAQVAALRVISRTSVMRFKGVRRPLPEIARELGVDAIVEGSALRSGERIRITAQLIDAANDQHLWAQTYERDLRDVLALQNEVARKVAAGMRVAVTSDERALMSLKRTVDPAAHEDYMRGRHYWNRRTIDAMLKGLDYFRSAVQKDPVYALAHAGIADSYAMLGAYTAITATEGAVRLSPSIDSGRTSRSGIGSVRSKASKRRVQTAPGACTD